MALLQRHHRLIRLLSLATLVGSLTYMGHQSRSRMDVTEEGLSRLTPETIEIIRNIDAEHPVTVHAFVSREVPHDYVEARSRLLNILREMESQGGPGLTVRIVEPEEFSEEAEEALEKYGIFPRELPNRTGQRVGMLSTFLGLAFVSGPHEEVVPFLSRGLSAEYEVIRALRAVTADSKKVVGILRTDAPLMGNFDIQTRQQQPAWRIVAELRKQYEVRSLAPTASVPEDVDVLFVPQLSSLAQPELDKVREYVDAGRPALLTADPMPAFNPTLAPSQPRPNPNGGGGLGGMMGGGGSPPPPPKGDYLGLLRDIGVEWADSHVAYDPYNPHPNFDGVPPQILFIGERPGAPSPFEGEGVDVTVQGLNEVVVLFGGELRQAAGVNSAFTPLLSTGNNSGYHLFEDMFSTHPLFGLQPMPQPYKATANPAPSVVAARVSGGAAPAAEGEGAGKPRNVVVIADLDLFHDQFFALRDQGGDVDGDGLIDIRFDNVSFLLNVVDSLVGDDGLIELRKRKSKFRRLTWIDEQTKGAKDTLEASRRDANADADEELEKAQKALDDAVLTIKSRADIDEQTKEVMVRSAEAAENRRLEVKKAKIERDKAKALNRIETDHKRKIDEVQDSVRLLAVTLPPLPAILLGIIIYGRRRRREHETIPASRSARS